MAGTVTPTYKFQARLNEVLPDGTYYYEFRADKQVSFNHPNGLTYMDLSRLVGIFGTSQIAIEGWSVCEDCNGDGEDGVTVVISEVMFGDEEGDS